VPPLIFSVGLLPPPSARVLFTSSEPPLRFSVPLTVPAVPASVRRAITTLLASTVPRFMVNVPATVPVETFGFEPTIKLERNALRVLPVARNVPFTEVPEAEVA